MFFLRRAALPFLAVSAILLFVSCASLPGIEDPAPEDDFALLPPGASLYLYAEIAGARPILELLSIGGISGADIPEILDRTDSLTAAFYPEGAGRRFLAAGRGRYPVFRTGLSLSMSSAWKKRRSETGGRYWYSAGYKLAAAIGKERALLSDTDPLVSSPGSRSPAGFEAFRGGAVLAGWLPDAAVPINAFFADREIPLQIPVQQIVFSVFPQGKNGEEEKYEITMRLETPSASHAQGLASIMTMMRLFMTAAFGPDDPLKVIADLFIRPPLREDANLILRSGPLGKRDLALLFNGFSLYSR
jgi:hypothetical protein